MREMSSKSYGSTPRAAGHGVEPLTAVKAGFRSERFAPISKQTTHQVCRSRMASASHATSSAQEELGASGRTTNFERPESM